MSNHARYAPGPAAGAKIEKDGEKWTLVLVRDLRHAPAKVWEALTDPAQLREWAPFDSDKNLGALGTARLVNMGSPDKAVSEAQIKRADAPKLLVYSWNGSDIRWELAPLGSGTRLTLWHAIPKGFISMGAAGWHVCFDVMDRLLSGDPIGRLIGPDALQHGGWQRLNVEYAQQFGIELPKWK